jgi:Tol biopolymer transport system component
MPVFYRFRVDTGATEELHRLSTQTSSWTLSPDGRTIYWAVQQEGRLVRYDIEGGRETVLRDGEWIMTVAVSPDGQSVAYARSPRDSATGHSIMVMPSSGGEAREAYRLAYWGPGRYNALAWTPDGRSLIFTKDDRRWWRVPVAGGEPQPFGPVSPGAATRVKAPAFSPDGRTLAFGTGEGKSELWSLQNVLPAAARRN